MRRVKIFIILLVIFSFSKVKAECDYNLNISLANNIAYSYKYNGSNFDLTFTNLNDMFYIVDQDDMYYSGYYEKTINNLEPNRTYTYKIYPSSLECENSSIRTINVKIPSYNKYYDSDICEDVKEFKYCKKWYENDLTYEEMTKKIDEYKKSLNEDINEASYKRTVLDQIGEIMLNIYTNYYFIILPLIIIGSIYAIYKLDKKDSLF